MEKENTNELNESISIVAIAINGGKKSKYVVNWALENLFQDGGEAKVSFKLLYVFPEIHSVPTPMGGGIPIAQVREDVATAYRTEVDCQTNERILPYKHLCLRKKVPLEVVKIESDDIVNAIADEITKHSIKKLVIGASSNSMFSSSYWLARGQNLSAKISEGCPSFCTVYVVSKGKLSSIRPSDPEALPNTRDDTIDTTRFSNANYSPNNSINSQLGYEEWRMQQNLSNSHPHLPPPSPTKNFQASSPVNKGLSERKINFSDDAKTLSYYMKDNEEEIISSSDMDSRSKFSSSFLSTDNHSWTTDQSSSLNASSQEFSSGSQVNINFELEQLRMELRQVQEMYAKTQSEALDASRKLNDLNQQRSEETLKLREINQREDEAKALAEQEKARYEAAKTAAEYAKECAEKEAALKNLAEKKAIRDSKTKEKLEDSLAAPPQHFQEFTWEEITSATSSFSNDLRVGMGSYGTVYKCTLRHTTAAVKILHSMAPNRSKQFLQELEILSKIRHPNLLTLLGACPERGCLVYEYMENGSLEERLLRKNKTPPIPWYDRFRMAREIASALVFLHNSKPKPIIHRDLKPANILLDQNLVSKIGDVGLSTMIHTDASNMTTMFKDTSPVGTLCYIDPEYQRTGLVSPKSDIYAFGMVVLQLLTAKPAMALTRAIESAIDNDCLERVLDTEAGKWPIEETKELAMLGLRCTELRHRDRPDLKCQILPILEKLRIVAEKARDSASTQPPTHFLCPLTKDVMSEPCVAADGYTYDRKAIEEWFEENDTSPVTNFPLQSKVLIPNYTLLTAIAEWTLKK